MRTLQDALREAPLRAPSSRLAERVADALMRAEPTAVPLLRIPVPLWACAAAALACGVLGYAGHGLLRPARPQIVYVLPAEGGLRRFLTGEAEERPQGSSERLRVRVTGSADQKL